MLSRRLPPFLLVLAALGGCAGAPPEPPASGFGGTWAGTLTDAESCSDGSGGTGTNPKRLVVVQQGAKATVEPGDCGTVSALISGHVLSLEGPVTCPVQHEQDGSTLVVQLAGGTLTLSDAGLAADLSLALVRTTADGEVRCTGHATGGLTRQP